MQIDPYADLRREAKRDDVWRPVSPVSLAALLAERDFLALRVTQMERAT
jgi:hypothetical protein